MATLQQTPKLADLFDYLMSGSKFGGQETPGYWHTVQVGGGEGGSVDAQEWVPGTSSFDASAYPDKYKGLMQGHTPGQAGGIEMPGTGVGGGDLTPEYRQGDSGQWLYNQDFLKTLPTTKFVYPKQWMGEYGPITAGNPGGAVGVTDVMSLGTGDAPDWSKYGGEDKFVNKNLTYFDPNYGWITPGFNKKPPKQTGIDKFAEILPQAIGAGLSMGFGYAGMPALATGMVGAARGLGNGGGWGQAALTALPGMLGAGLGLGGFSLPPQLSQLLNYLRSGYGLYNAAKTRNPIGGAMSLARLSGLGGEG